MDGPTVQGEWLSADARDFFRPHLLQLRSDTSGVVSAFEDRHSLTLAHQAAKDTLATVRLIQGRWTLDQWGYFELLPVKDVFLPQLRPSCYWASRRFGEEHFEMAAGMLGTLENHLFRIQRLAEDYAAMYNPAVLTLVESEFTNAKAKAEQFLYLTRDLWDVGPRKRRRPTHE